PAARCADDRGGDRVARGSARGGRGRMTDLSPKLRGRLEQIESRHRELGEAMSDPSVTGDRDKLRSVGQEYASLEAIVDTIGRLREAERRVANARELQE